MLNFLRKLRRSEMKGSKYLKYAIGEIILVVIGILIALQISDWNQSGKDKAFELFTLKEVENNLKEDLEQIERVLTKYTTMKESLENLSAKPFASFEEQEMAADIKNIWGFQRFFPIRNGYEALKSRGFQVSNPQLRTQLGRYYENELTRVTSSILDIEYSFIDQFNPIIKSGYLTAEKNGEISIRNKADKRFEADLKAYARSLLPNISGTVRALKHFIDSNERTMKAVNSEIKVLAN